MFNSGIRDLDFRKQASTKIQIFYVHYYVALMLQCGINSIFGTKNINISFTTRNKNKKKGDNEKCTLILHRQNTHHKYMKTMVILNLSYDYLHVYSLIFSTKTG